MTSSDDRQLDLGLSVGEPRPPMPAPELREAGNIAVIVRGIPRPQGNMTAKPIRHGPRAGQVAVYHENESTLYPWRQAVALLLSRKRAGEPWAGPVAVHIVFTMPKPKSAPRRRHTWPTKRPDLDKLIRAVLDAATEAGVWRDDSQAVMVAASKHYVGDGFDHVLDSPGAYINIWEVR